MILSLRLVYPRRSSPYLGFRSPTIPAVSDVAFWERSTGIMHDKKTGRDWVRHFLPLLRPFRKQLCVGGRTVLSHINLAIAPGEKIAIVGATGDEEIAAAAVTA